jgi:hypothetical protein
MAGSIVISKSVSLLKNSFAYHFIVEKTRPHFTANEQHILKEIYQGEDEAAMMFIDVSGVNKVGFNAFYRATKKGYEQALIEFPHRVEAWKELIDMLEADPRFDAAIELKN